MIYIIQSQIITVEYNAESQGRFDEVNRCINVESICMRVRSRKNRITENFLRKVLADDCDFEVFKSYLPYIKVVDSR